MSTSLEALQEQLERTRKASKLLLESLDAQTLRIDALEERIEEVEDLAIRVRITAIRQEANSKQTQKLLQMLVAVTPALKRNGAGTEREEKE
jgi:hypothetical protein